MDFGRKEYGYRTSWKGLSSTPGTYFDSTLGFALKGTGVPVYGFLLPSYMHAPVELSTYSPDQLLLIFTTCERFARIASNLQFAIFSPPEARFAKRGSVREPWTIRENQAIRANLQIVSLVFVLLGFFLAGVFECFLTRNEALSFRDQEARAEIPVNGSSDHDQCRKQSRTTPHPPMLAKHLPPKAPKTWGRVA